MTPAFFFALRLSTLFEVLKPIFGKTPRYKKKLSSVEMSERAMSVQ